ncbi:MAG: hypothetical protein NUW21_02525 [Elusimicrobia bacterium]|nr:hypothetical protein [Elusimicrobiota bacterium]
MGRTPLAFGAAFYCAAALADIRWTVAGIGGDLSLEGNPVMRGLMERIGSVPALFLGKAAVGLACFAIAKYGEPEIRRGAAWIDKVPSTRWARAWMKSGDRSWIAYVPLYGTAASQAAAALSWMILMGRG